MSRKALADLITNDKSGLVALMASGGDLTKHQLRSAERKKLEAKLSSDEHQRDVALGALSEVEQRTDVLEQQLATCAVGINPSSQMPWPKRLRRRPGPS